MSGDLRRVTHPPLPPIPGLRIFCASSSEEGALTSGICGCSNSSVRVALHHDHDNHMRLSQCP